MRRERDMVYIRKKITPEFLRRILYIGLELGASRFVIWFYPETSERKRARLSARFQHFALGRKALEAATLYNGEPIEKTPMVYRVEKTSIKKLASLFPKLTRLCDNVAVYKEDSQKFLCCSIFHEQMSFFNEIPGLESILTEWSILYTATPPPHF
jgi:hypothetical protein